MNTQLVVIRPLGVLGNSRTIPEIDTNQLSRKDRTRCSRKRVNREMRKSVIAIALTLIFVSGVASAQQSSPPSGNLLT